MPDAKNEKKKDVTVESVLICDNKPMYVPGIAFYTQSPLAKIQSYFLDTDKHMQYLDCCHI